MGDVEALLIIAHETPPARHPGEGSLDDLKALLALHLADDFDNEAEKYGLVHELGPVVAAIGEQMLQPWRRLR